MRRIFLATIIAMGATLLWMGGPAVAGYLPHGVSTTRHPSTWKGSFRECAHGHCHRVAVFSGHNAPKASLRTEPLDRPSGEIWLYAENLNEEVKVNIYKPDGSFDEAALAKLDELFRCVKTGEVRAVRPELYEQLSRIYDHFDHKRVSLVSGFRYAERDSSRHRNASAMDIHIVGVPIKEVYDFAATLDAGGMGLGIYPTGQFIHFDYRAPGEPSYRWVDYSGHSSKHHHKRHRTPTTRKPVS